MMKKEDNLRFDEVLNPKRFIDNVDGRTYYRISNQHDLDRISKAGAWGPKAQIGYYYCYLGISDGGFLIKSAEEVADVLKGKEEIDNDIELEL